MEQYRYLKDILERGEDIFITTGRQNGKARITETVNNIAKELNGNKHLDLRATKALKRNYNTQDYVRDTIQIKTKDYLRNATEHFVRNMTEAYLNSFVYFIDGNEVSKEEFFKYVSKLKMASVYGEVVTKKGESDEEYWVYPCLVAEGNKEVH